MTTLTTRQRTLIDALIPSTRWLTDVLLIVGFSVFVALSAQIAIPLPFTPVPITGQTLAVLLTGALLGWRRGGLALLLYLAEGAAGLPVFAGGAFGWMRLMGPTGGYLWSYPLAAALVGFLAERGWDRKLWTAALAMLLGNIVIYAIGAPWLAMQKVMPASLALQAIYPFLPGDAIKLVIATVVLPSGWRIVRGTED